MPDDRQDGQASRAALLGAEACASWLREGCLCAPPHSACRAFRRRRLHPWPGRAPIRGAGGSPGRRRGDALRPKPLPECGNIMKPETLMIDQLRQLPKPRLQAGALLGRIEGMAGRVRAPTARRSRATARQRLRERILRAAGSPCRQGRGLRAETRTAASGPVRERAERCRWRDAQLSVPPRPRRSTASAKATSSTGGEADRPSARCRAGRPRS